MAYIYTTYVLKQSKTALLLHPRLESDSNDLLTGSIEASVDDLVSRNITTIQTPTDG